MKILQLIQKKQLRGAEVFASQISNHLNQAGHEVLLMSLLNGNDQLPYQGKVYCLNVDIKKKWFDFSAWKRLNAFIRQHQPDLVQANAGDTLKYAVLSKLIFKWQQPIVFRNASMVSLYTKSQLSRILTRYLFRHVDHFLSVSSFTANDLMDHFQVSETDITILPVGVEQHPFKKLSCFDNHHSHLIHVGGFSFEKNHKGLLSIFKKLCEKHESLKLWLVGEGPLKDNVRALAISLGVSDKIEWVGFVNNPVDYIHSADILLLPSIIEGLPGVITEAFYCQTPVVAYNVGGISDLVENRLTGSLVLSGHEDAFVKAVEDLLQADNNAIHEMTDRANEKVMKGFVNTVIAKNLISVYEEILLQQKNKG